MVSTADAQSHGMTPLTRICTIHVHLATRCLCHTDDQLGVRRIDAFVGASQSPIARVQDAQPQADRTVVGHGDAQSNQAVEVRAHCNKVWVGLFRVVNARIVCQTRAERPTHKTRLSRPQGPAQLRLPAIQGGTNVVHAHKSTVLHAAEKGGPPVGGARHPSHMGTEGRRFHDVLHVAFRHPNPARRTDFRGPPTHLGLCGIGSGQCDQRDPQKAGKLFHFTKAGLIFTGSR